MLVASLPLSSHKLSIGFILFSLFPHSFSHFLSFLSIFRHQWSKQSKKPSIFYLVPSIVCILVFFHWNCKINWADDQKKKTRKSIAISTLTYTYEKCVRFVIIGKHRYSRCLSYQIVSFRLAFYFFYYSFPLRYFSPISKWIKCGCRVIQST